MSKSSFSRRKFLGASLLTGAGMSLLPQLGFASSAQPLFQTAHERVRLGFIGVGRQAMGLLNNFMKIPGVEVVAGADVYAVKRDRFALRVKKNQSEAGKPNVAPKLYADYRELLANPEVDAVVIASPDHWHALMAIDACRAKKDIYLEKPLTFTIKEGQELVKSVRANGVVLAVGSMQRAAVNFQTAALHVQKGRLGEINQVLVYVGENPHPKPYDLAQEALPAGLDWQAWLGPLPKLHFNDLLNPGITLDPEKNEAAWGAWRWYKETGGGLMTDWGAHMFDIAQWGLGMDRNGPIEVIPASGTAPLTYKYANGTEMLLTKYDEARAGVKFVGEKGWINVSRGNYDTSIQELQIGKEPENFTFGAHHVDFIDCVRKRKDPIVPVEVGHSTCTVCTIGNIAHEMNRPLKWDPIAQEFSDPDANTKLHYAYQNGYSLI
ncbi:Gfo/Idh/MocA family oxidoreductase [Algoriphagus sp. H41]|uniref:Gfo/Idh/MocA family oxidoreductase n=1 Tax=Algoriphagus oliviformis TaxID=2811231 RepID=A0ABS3BY66_9BACT|nr:Gfo/Idh/MocA family oxidoreductase [Algoriphagus oliviformis]MBN7809627.1 Gfo/Idh/MocA family oxidoreductase [Algoriphagus oliviformis]